MSSSIDATATTTSAAPAAASSSGIPPWNLYQDYSELYPKQLWWFCACFIFTVGIFQYGALTLNTLTRQRALARAHDVEGAARRVRTGLHRLPTAIVNAYRVMAFRWTFRLGKYTLNMAEVFITAAYVGVMFIWTFIHTPDFQADYYNVGYWANRAGTVGTSQITLMTALGTKNNLIGFITGISHEKLNYAHRLTARVIFVLIWFHSAGRLALPDLCPMDEPWLRAGLAGIVGFSVLILSSVRPVRQRCYEFFFVVHFLMALIFLLAGYFHAAPFEYGYGVWPALVIWGLDRFIRFMRVVAFNHLYFWFTKSSALDATAELLSPTYIRLRMTRPAHFHWNPAQMAYLIAPSVSLFPWEAHPFTIASVDTSRDAHADAVRNKAVLGDSTPYWKELVFLVEVRNGFTKRLAEVAKEGRKVKVAIDGPYGNSPDLRSDDTVFLVSGESGVTHILATFISVVNDVRDGKSICSKIIFLWSIRDASQIEWVSNTFCRALEVAPPSLSISVRVHVTGAAATSLPSSGGGEKGWDGESVHGADSERKTSAPPSLLDVPVTQVCAGRADLRALLHDEAAAGAPRMSVTVCASLGVVNAVRDALSFPVSSPAAIMRGDSSVVLHVESFSYA